MNMENTNFGPPVSKEPQGKKNNLSVILGIVVVLIAVVVTYLFLPESKKEVVKENVQNIQEQIIENIKPAIAFSSKFSVYEEVPVVVTPQVKDYSVNQDLSNVINVDDFYLSDEAKALLNKNAFAVMPAYHNEFYPLYEDNRYHYLPSFITTDSILHNYHLVFDYLLKNLEEEKLFSELQTVNSQMLAESVKQYESLKGSEWENAARRNVGFFAVGASLLDSSTTVPEFVKDEVSQELNLIADHQGITASPVINIGSNETIIEKLKEDYSQYIPRGHYEKSEKLQKYFKSMMWYGRLSFRMKSEDEIKSALLITLALNKDDNKNSWNAIYEPVNFFVGKSDDITYYQFRDLLEETLGKEISFSTLTSDKEKLAEFVKATEKLEPPQINSIPVFNSEIQPDREKEIKAFRFMGQRFTIDAAIFQRLVDRETPNRMLPKGLDIPSAMGSGEALDILTEMGETKYEKYSTNMLSMRKYVDTFSVGNWTQNLYWSWLYQLRPLLEEKGSGYPIFMQNKAWVRKDLNTYLGSWSELKHDTILYAKQVYAEMGGGPDEPQAKDDRGYVEPNVYVYARLASLLKMTKEGLESRALLTEAMKDNISKMETLALKLKTISEKELNNENLTDEEYELIRSYGGQLEHFWLEVNKDDKAFSEYERQSDYLMENPSAIISDVATDPNGQVLEEATARIYDIYVVVPIDGELRIAKGGVYSYYEFAWDLSDRLTDSKWRDMLNNGEAPELPTWTNSFVAQ